MTQVQFRNYQEQSFDAFCKKVIRNEAINIHKRLMALAEKEIPLSALTVSDISALCYEDVYRTYQKTYYVQGRPIRIADRFAYMIQSWVRSCNFLRRSAET